MPFPAPLTRERNQNSDSIEDCSVQVNNFYDDGSSGSGTAIWYDAETKQALVTTAGHIFQRHNGTASVSFPKLGKHYRGRVLSSTTEPDLAILAIQTDGPVPVTMVARDDPTPGMPVTKVGFPAPAMVLNRRQGIVNKVQRHVFYARLIVRPGDSGGGIFNDEGYQVGVATAYIVSNPNIGIGTPCCCIRDVLRKIWPRFKRERPRPPRANDMPPADDPFERPNKPVPPVADHVSQADFKALRAEFSQAIAELKQGLGAVESELKKGSVGTPGPAGPPGPPGKDGRPGQDGTVGAIDYDKLAAALAGKIKPAPIDYDKLAAEVQKRLPPSPAYFSITPRPK